MEDIIYPLPTDKSGVTSGSKFRCSIKVLPGGAKSSDHIKLIRLPLLITTACGLSATG